MAEEVMKKKKSHKVLIIIIILLTVLIILPIALLFILLFDPSTKRVNVNENFSVNEMGERIMVDSLDNARSQKIASMLVTEEDFDNILYMAQKKIEGQASNYLDKFYCKIDDGNYNFYIDAHFAFFKTRGILRTKLVEPEDENYDENAIKLKIKGISLARLSVPFSFIESIAGDSFDLDKIFKDAGLEHCTLDKDTNTLVYPYKGMIQDVTKMMNGKGDLSFLTDLLNELADRNMISMPSDVNGLGLNIDLSSLEASKSIYYDSSLVKDNHEGIKNKVLPTLNTALVNGKSNSEINTLFKDSFQNNFITPSSSDSIFDTSSNNMEEKWKQYAIKQPVTFTINEQGVNDYLASIPYLGTAYTFSRKVSEGNYKINYISFDNLYIKLLENKLALNLGLNINGMEGLISFTANDQKTNEFGKLSLKISDIKLGGMTVGETFKNEVYDFIYNALKDNNADTCLSFNKNQELTFDFVEALQNGVNAGVDSTALPTDGKTLVKSYLKVTEENTKIEPLINQGNLSVTITNKVTLPDSVIAIINAL